VGKRTIDFLLAVSLLILVSPLILFLIILILFDSKGKALLKLKRVGKNGQEFYMYKLRTMYPGTKKLQGLRSS